MARTFRRRQNQQPIAELNITNLMDVAFVLLIIFMIASPLIQQEQTIPVNLPSESERPQQTPPPEQRFQTISIDASGQYFWGAQAVSMNELSRLLENEARQPEPAAIRIRAASQLQYQRVVTLMDEIMKHKLTKISFDTVSHRSD